MTEAEQCNCSNTIANVFERVLRRPWCSNAVVKGSMMKIFVLMAVLVGSLAACAESATLPEATLVVVSHPDGLAFPLRSRGGLKPLYWLLDFLPISAIYVQMISIRC